MKRFLLSAALLAAATTTIQAHTLDGIVKDNKTGEPLIGTVIRVKELPNVSTTTGLDGTFTLHELPDKGKVTIIVSYMSYKTREMVVDVAEVPDGACLLRSHSALGNGISHDVSDVVYVKYDDAFSAANNPAVAADIERINQAKEEGKTPDPKDLELVKTEKQNAFAISQYTVNEDTPRFSSAYADDGFSVILLIFSTCSLLSIHFPEVTP